MPKRIFLFTFLIFIYLYGCKDSDVDEQVVGEYLYKGKSYCQTGQFEEGIQQFDIVIGFDPENYDAFLYRGMAYRDIKDDNKAIEDFEKCIQINPDGPKAYFELSSIWSNQGNFTKAVKYLTKAIKADKNFVNAYATRAILNVQMGRMNHAVKDMNDAITINSKDPMLYIARAHVFEKQGDCQSALSDFEKAKSMNNKISSTNSNIAWILATCQDENLRNGTEAFELASQAIKNDSRHFTLHIMAAACAEIGDFKKAINYQEKSIQLLKKEAPAHNFARIFIEQQLKDYSKQLKSYKNNKPWRLKKKQ